jgi:hypothetical protein
MEGHFENWASVILAFGECPRIRSLRREARANPAGEGVGFARTLDKGFTEE